MPAENQERINNLDEAISYNLLQSSKQKVKEGRVILIAIAAINLISLLFISSTTLTMGMIIALSYTALFLILAILVSKIPNKAIIIGLTLYLAPMLILALFNPATLLQGALIKLIIISGLVKAFLATKDVKELQKKLTEIERKRANIKS